jgi:hypothetical protein
MRIERLLIVIMAFSIAGNDRKARKTLAGGSWARGATGRLALPDIDERQAIPLTHRTTARYTWHFSPLILLFPKFTGA